MNKRSKYGYYQPNRIQRTQRTILVIAVLVLLLLVGLLISINTGQTPIPLGDVIRTLFGIGEPKDELIIMEFRLPRILITMLAGAGLSAAGAVLQGVTRNGLADPGILGINAGAGLGVVLFITLNSLRADASPLVMPLMALIGAMGAAAVIYAFAYRRHKGLSATRLLLAGIAVAAGLQSLTMILSIRLDPQNYTFVANWLAGSIWGTNWAFVLALLPWILVLLPFILWKSKELNVLQLGDQLAAGLGSSIHRQRLGLLAAAVALSAACVSISGAINFLGLVGPHLARRLVGPRHEHLVPVSALIGALLLLVSDCIGRWVMQPSEIPTGIVVAVIGAPYFLFLLYKARK
ncbi:iron ABC transporter permease [Paenibacillus sp. JX-17]|uniref:Iron ABC transporter permease n=1 Tax=Paenibacillus lacisoli TaxID=3064525 RepID=A0ABT9CC61_9BACL|nr:iron ABC transporter permease [Paenibacillus sp. JX-17]MDO7906460.1 iron ABC transporter permease [Paenibacillus sp. JX-17]